ncbi:MAG: radical SAM protein [Reyranella sp.]|nr:radical SAM protein [Reyranella sp.]
MAARSCASSALSMPAIVLPPDSVGGKVETDSSQVNGMSIPSPGRAEIHRNEGIVPETAAPPRSKIGFVGQQGERIMDGDIAQLRQGLDFVWLEITGRCNLRCTHCYANSGPELPLESGMQLGDWLRALDEAAALGCRKVQFIGGEPTLHPGLPQLIAHARARDFRSICVYTNGTHFTDSLKTTLVAHRVTLAFSVYGSSAETHDRVTLRPGAFERTLSGIRWAIDAGLSVSANIIEMEANAHDVDAAARMLRDMGAHSLGVDRLRGLGRGHDERPAQPRLRELCGRCGDGKVCISASGAIFPCVFSRFVDLGHFKSGGLGAAVSGAPLGDFRSSLEAAQPWISPSREAAAAESTNRGHGLSPCTPEEPAPPCRPEQDPGPCRPEQDPGPCRPEQDPGPCRPEQDPGPCRPEQDPGPCRPERDPGPCIPEHA